MKTLRLALAGSLALPALLLSVASPSVAATPTESLASTAGYGGYGTGSVVYANALNSGGDPDLAKVALAQSGAAASVGEPLVTQDLLASSLLTAASTGKNAYGHGAAAGVGLGQAETAPPQIALTTSEAVSPPASDEATDELLSLPAAPLATAQLLPSKAQSLTTSVDSLCVTGATGRISAGLGQAAGAQLLSPGAGQAVATVDGAVASLSELRLTTPAGGAGGKGLASVTTQSLAPLTLFKGVPGAETTIQVLHQLQLSATAGGAAGTAKAFYGFVDAAGTPVPDSEPVLAVNGTSLTSEQVLGGDGVQLSLGVADVFLGAPAHALDDDPTSKPLAAAQGTTAAAAADLVRVKVPGTVPTGSTRPVATDSPLAPVLNPVLEPVVQGLKPVLDQVQSGLAGAGLGVADLRYGHLEALATVPAGGISCAETQTDDGNPFDESRKDVSAFTVAPGEVFEYTVRFPNRGTAPVTGVTVKDVVGGGPPPLEFLSSTPAPASRSGSTLTYTVASVAPGAYVDIALRFRVPTSATPGTTYGNSATITGTYQGRPVSQAVSVTGPTVIQAPAGPCEVGTSTKYASNTQVTTGELFAYYVNVANSGGPCRGVVVTDRLDPGVAFVSCSDGCTRTGQVVTWQLGALAPGESTTLKVVVRTVATSGRLPNEAEVTTQDGDTARPSTPGPVVTSTSVPAPGRPAGCPTTGCPVTPEPGPLPRTGAGTALPLLGALVVGGALWLRRRTA